MNTSHFSMLAMALSIAAFVFLVFLSNAREPVQVKISEIEGHCCEKFFEFDAVVLSSNYYNNALRVKFSDGNTVSGVAFNPSKKMLSLAQRGEFVKARGYLERRGQENSLVLLELEPND